MHLLLQILMILVNYSKLMDHVQQNQMVDVSLEPPVKLLQQQAACIKNSTNEDCYWTGTTCVDKICSNAPTTLTTNSVCAAFSKGCITKQGGGCVLNGDCSAANISTACVKKHQQFRLYLGIQLAKKKHVQMLQNLILNHDQCTSYLSTCTVQSGGGCQKRTCDNAPITLNTNDACETYLPANKCITKNGGGCTINTTCSLISIEAAIWCFWHVASGSCKDKICVNAPSQQQQSRTLLIFFEYLYCKFYKYRMCRKNM
ncbi:unnamed protein product (macronuclear) [Paramecium tetraurelia]|uniref:Uncharacterized protein n=1 Tax=Paramecium tetraurelia TaxID=5888 RepID=A0CHG0_PARTE|nr:uncharacterized protein GSPATT00038329001 [Paramecium tetraurelia]CAK70227.1 unnamed protein product [Paramecium tetraurelia]|eukprot:XP_001437624.1 hypothetical protein (macronuclear) [Paramecium tetraurelia strain d4-2]